MPAWLTHFGYPPDDQFCAPVTVLPRKGHMLQIGGYARVAAALSGDNA